MRHSVHQTENDHFIFGLAFIFAGRVRVNA
jgi:hypothetical protein